MRACDVCSVGNAVRLKGGALRRRYRNEARLPDEAVDAAHVTRNVREARWT